MSFNEILLIPNKSQINPDFLNTSLRLTCVVTRIDNSYLVCRMFMNISPDPFQSFRTCPANSGFRCWPVKKLIRPVRSSPTFTVQITYSSDLKFSACNHEFAKVFFSFFLSLEQSFRTVDQNNFGNKIPFLAVKTFMTRIIHLPFSVICIKTTTVTTQQQKNIDNNKKNTDFFLLTKPFIFSLVSLFFIPKKAEQPVHYDACWWYSF